MSASASESTTTSSARLNRYSGSSPAVAGDPRGDGRNCGNDGFEAASTVSTSRSRLRVDGDVRAPRMDPLDGPSGVVDDETLALEPGGIAVEAEVDHGLDAAAGPVLRDLTGQAEPCRPPRRTPPRTDGEVGEPVERRPGLDRELRPIGLDERNDPLPHSRAMRRSTSARSSCTHARYPTPGNDPSELSASDCQMRHLKQTERGFRRGSGGGDGEGFGAAAAGADRVAHALALDEGRGRLGADGLMFVWCTNRSASSGRAMKP